MPSGLEDEFAFDVLRHRSAEQQLSSDEANALADQIGFDDLRRAASEKLRTFGRGGVANPNQLEAFGIRPWFFLATGRTGQFEQVIKATSAATSGISHYVLYGDSDALIVLYGTDHEAERFSDHLAVGAYEQPVTFSAEKVLLTRGLLPVPSTGGPSLSDEEILSVNNLIVDFDDPESKGSRQRFIDSGHLLGAAWRDVKYAYAPVTAFVGIYLRGRSALSPSAVLASLAGDRYISPALLDLYQVKASLPYHYLARIGCESLGELDRVTDTLATLRIGNVDLKCTTQVVASCSEAPPMFRQPEISQFNAGPSITEMTRETEDIFRLLSSENQRLFNLLSGSQQLRFVNQYLRLNSVARNPQLDSVSASHFRTAMQIFVNEVLEKQDDTPNLSASVTEVAQRVEQLSRELLTRISWSSFGRDAGLAQRELKLPSRSISGLSLGKVVSAFRTAASNANCERFHSILEDDAIERIDSFSQNRNLWVHGANVSSARDQADEAVRTILLAHDVAIWLGVQIDTIDGHLNAARERNDRDGLIHFFISHASEDKDSVARPISNILTARGFTVWLDETELTLGDSLRESIDEAISSCHFGIVILSPNCFSKNWPQQELNALFARQMQGQKIILPIWHEVDRSVVTRYAPLLADRLAASTADGIEPVVEQIVAAYGMRPSEP